VTSAPVTRTIEYLIFIREIEDFLYREAALLDERKFTDWLDLLADDIRYWMPIRRNMSFRDRDRDTTGPDDIGWLDDNKLTLDKRVRQIMTGVHWAEEPLSRVSRLISNVHLKTPVSSLAEGETVVVKSNFLAHRNRLETETDILAGRREDVLRRVGNGFQIAGRTIIIDQSVLLVKALTFFL
jgi:3-phenylpropionate/cinnamic acid dioxygenase small subunit